QAFDQRALARAVGADETVEFIFPNCEVDAGQGHQAAKNLRQAARFKQRHRPLPHRLGEAASEDDRSRRAVLALTPPARSVLSARTEWRRAAAGREQWAKSWARCRRARSSQFRRPSRR